MNKNINLCLFLLILFCTTNSYTQDNGFGAGIILGEPTGISAKYWLNDVNAFDYALGSSLASSGRIHLHIDYIWHVYNLIQTEETIALYYGPGIRVKTREYGKSVLGIRGVMGAVWFVKTAPLDVFAEIVPVLNLSPDVDISVNAGIGARFYFE